MNFLTNYEERCGDQLPLNVSAKLLVLGGIALFAEAMASNATTKEGLLPFAMMCGGLILNKLTQQPKDA